MNKIKILICVTWPMAFQSSFAQININTYADYLQPGRAINTVSMVMVHDVVSPPVAGRYYAYSMLGAYTIIASHNKSIPPLQNVIKSYQPTFSLDTVAPGYNYQIAAYYSILETARLLLPSGFMLKDDEDSFVALLQKAGIKQAVIDQSVKVAVKASAAIVSFSRADHYNQLSALKRYTPVKGEGYWYPTPPAYMEAVEPNWKTIRTMVIDSSNQFKLRSLLQFSKDTASDFFKQAKAVYTTSKKLTADQTEQALFWDCNPFAITTSGHMSIGFKKISPGGHWMNITALATRQAHLNFDQSVMILTLEGATLMDAFISCWEEKYDSNRIRPETFINRYMDIQWRPVLQTPPFPEYTSGHAVVSNASAELLTYLLGDNFAYTDDTELLFGSGKRSFTSFRQAAAEASMSRFYGGIHYMESIERGNQQGKTIAYNIIDKIKKAGIAPFKTVGQSK